jgi:threonine synthase
VDYCDACGAPVVAEPTQTPDAPLRGPGQGIWRYAEHLPVHATQAWLGLGEGTAAVVRADDLAARIGVRAVWLALECLGPTGSFKDRAAAAGVAHAVEHGVPGVVCASSGNAAAATAAYAARARLPAVLVVPEDTPPAKLAAARAFGALVLRAPGDYSNSFALARELCARLGFANLATTYVNPTAVAGLRTVAFDLTDRLGPATVDRVVVPTGAGALVHGVAAGYRYLAGRGDAAHVPRVDVVQLEGCAPIVRAFARGESAVRPWERVTTGVSGLNDPLRGYPGDGTVTLGEVRGTGGAAVSVTDAAAFAAQRELATRYGVLVEPAAATAVAALPEIGGRVPLSRDESVVCLLTGHGLKTLDVDPAGAASAPVVRTVDEADAAVRGHARH